jgi:hypothetical protein
MRNDHPLLFAKTHKDALLYGFPNAKSKLSSPLGSVNCSEGLSQLSEQPHMEHSIAFAASRSRVKDDGIAASLNRCTVADMLTAAMTLRC